LFKVVLIKKFLNNHPPSLKAPADRSAWVPACRQAGFSAAQRRYMQ